MKEGTNFENTEVYQKIQRKKIQENKKRQTRKKYGIKETQSWNRYYDYMRPSVHSIPSLFKSN